MKARPLLGVSLLAGAVMLSDQTVKAVVRTHLQASSGVEVIDGFLALRLGLNRGVAFGLLAGLALEWQWLVALLPLLALVALARMALPVVLTGGWLTVGAIGLILGGALSNLVDRARFGGVVDFIDVYWRDYHWPAFNLADAAITVGVGLFAALTMVPDQQRRSGGFR